jgi:hypothetical protein
VLSLASTLVLDVIGVSCSPYHVYGGGSGFPPLSIRNKGVCPLHHYDHVSLVVTYHLHTVLFSPHCFINSFKY